MGPRDLELISVVRALDAETRLGIQRPPLLTWLAEDYPELFGADDLEVTHPLHTLRRLIDAPLPLLAAGLY